MALGKFKLEAGQGGKLGHGNMAHWDHTETIKEATKKRRRRQDRKLEYDAKTIKQKDVP